MVHLSFLPFRRFYCVFGHPTLYGGHLRQEAVRAFLSNRPNREDGLSRLLHDLHRTNSEREQESGIPRLTNLRGGVDYPIPQVHRCLIIPPAPIFWGLGD
jgi:hypothetical protein